MDVAFGIGPFPSIVAGRGAGGKRGERDWRDSIVSTRTHENESRADSNTDRLINYPSLPESRPNPSHSPSTFLPHEAVYPPLELEACCSPRVSSCSRANFHLVIPHPLRFLESGWRRIFTREISMILNNRIRQGQLFLKFFFFFFVSSTTEMILVTSKKLN